MSKNFWFNVTLLFSAVLILFVLVFFYFRADAINETPKQITEICVSQTYEALKKFGINQEEDSIKAIFISIFNIIAVKEVFIKESVDHKFLISENIKDNEKFIKTIVKFNNSMFANVFLFFKEFVKVLEDSNPIYDNLKIFFNNFKDGSELSKKELNKIENKNYETINKYFKGEFSKDYGFTKKQKLKFNEREFDVFDYVYHSFINTYKQLKE